MHSTGLANCTKSLVWYPPSYQHMYSAAKFKKGHYLNVSFRQSSWSFRSSHWQWALIWVRQGMSMRLGCNAQHISHRSWIYAGRCMLFRSEGMMTSQWSESISGFMILLNCLWWILHSISSPRLVRSQRLAVMRPYTQTHTHHLFQTRFRIPIGTTRCSIESERPLHHCRW